MKREQIIEILNSYRIWFGDSMAIHEDAFCNLTDDILTLESKQIEKYKELIDWLDNECPAVSPPLEPYTTADLSHDFAEILRSKLDDTKKLNDMKKKTQLRKNTKNIIMKQGSCGSFCIKYWLGDGCDEDCTNGLHKKTRI